MFLRHLFKNCFFFLQSSQLGCFILSPLIKSEKTQDARNVFSLSVQTEALEIYGTSSFFQAPTFFSSFFVPLFCEIVREEEKRNGEEGEENCDRALTSDPRDQSSSSSRNKIGSCWSIFFPPYFSPPKQAVWIRFQAGLCARPSH